MPDLTARMRIMMALQGHVNFLLDSSIRLTLLCAASSPASGSRSIATSCGYMGRQSLTVI